MTALTETRPALYVRSIATRRRPHLVGEVLIVFVLLRVYDMARARAEVRQGPALQHGQAILDVERWLHVAVEQSMNIWVTAHHAASLLASYFYQFAHVTVTLSVLGWCWVRRPEIYRVARNALVLTNVIGLTVFLVLPVAPPRLLPGEGFVDAVALAGFGTTHGGPVPADQYGALPSLHLAWAVWATVIAMRMLGSSPYRRLCWIYPALVTIGVVVTGNHYLLDAVAGTLVAVSALALVQGSETYFPRKPRAAAVSSR